MWAGVESLTGAVDSPAIGRWGEAVVVVSVHGQLTACERRWVSGH